MHKNSKLLNPTWEKFHTNLKDKYEIRNEFISLSQIFVNDLKKELDLTDDDFSLGISKILTFYNKSNVVVGNIRFNKNSIRIEPVFTNDNSVPHNKQADGYDVHNKISITNIQDYEDQKETIFKLLRSGLT